MNEGLGLLAERSRKRVLEALEDGFGGRSLLFVSLWQSSIPTLRQFESEGGEPGDYDWRYETNPSDVLNLVTPEKAQAFEWLAQGAYPYRH
ncbi:MAG: hypothetical protein DMF61_24905 [Blastocatellia bacterium AA13]|nr:MAG: hypothetical protein DMF61_24905 [Blastocatellia bacterium AA13]